MSKMYGAHWMVWGPLSTALLLAACAGDRPADKDYQAVETSLRRDLDAAQDLHRQALELIEENQFPQAEPLLKRALEADVTYGPAHNSLGVVYLRQGKLYLAAWEFQYAAKLMPNQPEPRNNLGLVLETVGRLDDAVNEYQQALTLQPDNPELIGNLTRARVRRGDSGNDVRQLLEQIVMHDTRRDWVQWAGETLIRMPAESGHYLPAPALREQLQAGPTPPNYTPPPLPPLPPDNAWSTTQP